MEIKYFFFLLFSLFVLDALGQSKLPVDSISKKVVFRQVIELDSTYAADYIFSVTKEWFSTNSKNFNRSNSDKNYNTGDLIFGNTRGSSTQIDQLHKNEQPLKLFDVAEKKLVGKSVLKYTATSMGCFRVLFVESDIKVYVKDYKLKVEITNINYTHYNQISMKQSQIYGFGDNGTCNSKNTIENLLLCDHCVGELDDFLYYLTTDAYKLMIDLRKYLTDDKISESSDDW